MPCAVDACTECVFHIFGLSDSLPKSAHRMGSKTRAKFIQQGPCGRKLLVGSALGCSWRACCVVLGVQM